MNPQEFTLLLMTVSVGVAGQFFLKMGALKLVKIDMSDFTNHILEIITIPELLAGLTCYFLGSMGYIALLTRIKISVVGPSIALGYVFSVVLGYFIFREEIPFSRLVGLGFIVSGVLLVLWKN